MLVVVLSVHDGAQNDLLQVALAARLPRLLARLGEDREEDRRQDGDDRNDDQQLDEREALAPCGQGDRLPNFEPRHLPQE